VKRVTTRGSNECEFGIIDAGEVEGTSGLHFAQIETEWPCEGGKILENVVWEIRAVHFWNDCVVIDIGGILEEGNTIDVERRLLESEFGIPVITRSLTGNEVDRFHWVVEICEINLCIGIGGKLVLSLGDEKFVFIICEIFTFVCVQVDVVTPNLGSADWGISVTALDADLHVVVLEGHQRENLGPILTEEEGNHEVVTTVVGLFIVGCNGTRSLGRVITEKWVVDTLNKQRIQLRHLLAADPETKLSWAGGACGKETVGVGLNI